MDEFFEDEISIYIYIYIYKNWLVSKKMQNNCLILDKKKCWAAYQYIRIIFELFWRVIQLCITEINNTLKYIQIVNHYFKLQKYFTILIK